MPQNSNDVYQGFFRQIQRCDWTINNISVAYHRAHLVRRDVAQAYEAIFLQAVVAFELFVEDLFLGLVANTVTHPRACIPRVVFPNVEVARRIVGQGRYIDWLPLDRMTDRAKHFFDDRGSPLVCLTPVQREEVKKALLIRNLIAHKSTHARTAFERDVLQGLVLPPRRRDLLGYLEFGHAANVSKYQYHVGELTRAAYVMAH